MSKCELSRTKLFGMQQQHLSFEIKVTSEVPHKVPKTKLDVTWVGCMDPSNSWVWFGLVGLREVGKWGKLHFCLLGWVNS